MVEYICGHCKPNDEDLYRSNSEGHVRSHITQSKDAHHRDINGNSLEAIVLRVGEDDKATLSISLSELESKNKTSHLVYATMLEFPYLKPTRLSNLIGVSRETANRWMENNHRIKVERDRLLLDYIREDSSYIKDRKLAVDEIHRKIINYVQNNPEKNAIKVIEDLDLDLSVGEVERICKDYILPLKVPHSESHRDILLEAYKNAEKHRKPLDDFSLNEINLSEVSRKSDVAWGTARRVLKKEYRYKHLKPEKIEQMVFGEELEKKYRNKINQTKETVTDEKKDIEYEEKEEKIKIENDMRSFEGEPINSTYQYITERPIQDEQKDSKKDEKITIQKDEQVDVKFTVSIIDNHVKIDIIEINNDKYVEDKIISNITNIFKNKQELTEEEIIRLIQFIPDDYKNSYEVIKKLARKIK